MLNLHRKLGQMHEESASLYNWGKEIVTKELVVQETEAKPKAMQHQEEQPKIVEERGRLRHLCDAQDVVIQANQKQIKELHGQIRELEDKVRNKDQTLTKFVAKCEEQSAEVVNLSHQIEKKDLEIEGQEEEMVDINDVQQYHQNETRLLQEALARKSNQNAAMTRELVTKDAHIKERDAQVAELFTQLKGLSEEIGALQLSNHTLRRKVQEQAELGRDTFWVI